MSNKIEILLPKMGESVDEATITGWLKNEGDIIEEDDLIVEIATDKVDSEVPSEVSGVLIKKLCKINDVVRVGQPIALIETSSETKSISVSEKPDIEIKDTNEETKPIDFIKNAEILIDKNEFKSSEKFYSPLVKNISKKEGVSIEELNSISGTGKNGRVTKNDLLNYISSKSKPSNYSKDTTEHSSLDNHSDEIIEMSRMEKLISDHMLMSKQKSAHVQAFIEVDISELWNWREKIKDSFFQRENQKITFTPIFIYIVAQVLREFPMLNITVEDHKIIKKKSINIGMATALNDGNLIVPVIKNADQLSLIGLVRKVNDLASRGRNGQLIPDEVQDGTYTISNVGVFDTLMGTPIINQPQVAILALGAIRKVPAVIETSEGDFIGIRQKMFVSHSYDHRVINGALGGTFIKTLKETLEAWDINQEF